MPISYVNLCFSRSGPATNFPGPVSDSFLVALYWLNSISTGFVTVVFNSDPVGCKRFSLNFNRCNSIPSHGFRQTYKLEWSICSYLHVLLMVANVLDSRNNQEQDEE